jgi:hypothetical protein
MKKSITYPIKKIGNGIDKLLAGASGFAGGTAFSQIPGYISHYTQRLGGHLGEAIRNVDSWQNIADKTTNGSLDTLVNAYNSSNAPEVIGAGAKAAGDIARQGYLQRAYESLTNADIWTKPIEFIKNFDYDIALGTIKDYIPNIPMTPEGLIYAAVGVAAGVGAYYLIKKCGKYLIKQTPKLGNLIKKTANNSFNKIRKK